MAEYHVGCGAFGIYAGTLNSRNKNLWQNKTECTDEALCAVRDYMINELLGGIDCSKAVSGGYEWTLQDGRVVELRVTVKDTMEETCATCTHFIGGGDFGLCCDLKGDLCYRYTPKCSEYKKTE